MNQSSLNKIKTESIYLASIFLVSLIILKIAFNKESILTILKTTLSIFWLFLIPGYFLTLRLNLSFLHKTFIGTGIAIGITGTLSYYFGLFGLNVNYHHTYLPLLLIILGFIISRKNIKNHDNQ